MRLFDADALLLRRRGELGHDLADLPYQSQISTVVAPVSGSGCAFASCRRERPFPALLNVFRQLVDAVKKHSLFLR